MTTDWDSRCKWNDATTGGGSGDPEDDTITQPWDACGDDKGATGGDLLGNYGNPYAVRVVSEEAAIVAFRTYSGATVDGGIALLLTDTGVEETILVPLSFTNTDSGTCGYSGSDYESLFLDWPRIELDTDYAQTADGAAGDWDLRFLVAFWGDDAVDPGTDPDDGCGIWVLETSGTAWTETATDWTPVDMTAGGDCALDRETLQGIATAPWAPDTVFAFGGPETTVSTSAGGVCALPFDGAGDYASSLVQVVDPADWTFTVRAVEPHPVLAHTLLVGSRVPYADLTGYDTPGLVVSALRQDLAGGEEWVTGRPGESGFVNPGVQVIQWPLTAGADPRVYVGTNGSGVLEAEFSNL